MKYTVLLRGINVGGKNVVKMKDLYQLFVDLGLQKVKTYVQSGNVVFESDTDESSLRDMIHASFANRFGFESGVIIRNIDEMRLLIEHLPMTHDEIMAAKIADPQAEHLYVYFLDSPPERSQIDAICKEYAGPDILRAGKREVYLLCLPSIRKSKLAVRASKIFASATVRNWKTVSNLCNMLTEI